MSTKPTTDNKVTNIVLKAIRRRFINRGVHPTRIVHVPSKASLVVRHTNTRCKTVITHDGLKLLLRHHNPMSIVGMPFREISLSDPELIDKAVNWIAEWD